MNQNKRGRPISKNPKSKQYMIRFTECEMSTLKNIAEIMNIPVSQVIREALDLYFRVNGYWDTRKETEIHFGPDSPVYWKKGTR